MNEPAFVNMIKIYMAREAGETLIAPKSFDVEAYKQQLQDRFSNNALKHRTWQIAMDGTQKLPQRLLESLRVQLRGAGHIDIICLGIAAWIRYVSGVDENGKAIEVSDPLSVELRMLCDANKNNPEALVRSIIALQQVFGQDLAKEERFMSTTIKWLEKFYAQGVLTTVKTSFTN